MKNLSRPISCYKSNWWVNKYYWAVCIF